MGLLFWKNNRQIDTFAHTVADDLFSYVQPEVARDLLFGGAQKNSKQRRKIEQKVNDIVLQMRRFSDSQSLGIYGKARLQREFNGRLQELGYDDDVVNKLTEIVLLQSS